MCLKPLQTNPQTHPAASPSWLRAPELPGSELLPPGELWGQARATGESRPRQEKQDLPLPLSPHTPWGSRSSSPAIPGDPNSTNVRCFATGARPQTEPRLTPLKVGESKEPLSPAPP